MPLTNKIKFKALPTGDETTDEGIVESGIRRGSSKGNIKSWAFSVFNLALVALATYSFTRMRYTPAEPSLSTVIKHSPCGSNADEARAAGCHFEVMTWCWQADACYDVELETQFRTYTDWHFFRDQEGKSEVLPSEYGELERRDELVLYTSWEYHIVHCLFVWRKMHRAPQLGLKWDGYIKDFTHTMHCSGILQNYTVSLDDIATTIHTGFPSC